MASEMFCSWSVISDTRNRKNRRGSARTRCSSPQVPERRRTGWVKEGQPFGFLRGGAPQDKQETLVEHFTNLKLTKSDKLEDVELLSVQQNIPPVVLQTDLTKCPVCCVGDMVERTASTSDMVIYGRNGLKMAKHKKFRCSNRNKEQGICPVIAYHGYISYGGDKIYAENCLKNKVLVTSSQTAFEIDYLIEVVADIYILQGCFEGIAKKFNRLNNRNLPTDTLERRMEVCRKRITDAFFLFSYLEYGQRYGITGWQIVKEGNLEETVIGQKEALQIAFQERWTKEHHCEKPGCESVVIIDADLKPHRMLCAAKLCGVREFKRSDVKVVTGCTEMPGTKNKYCFKHRSEESPILTEEKITKITKEKLKKYRKETSTSEKAPKDQLFIIEAVKEIKKINTRHEQYLVKWSGYEDEASTWEPQANVPKFIQEFYKEDSSRLGKKLPNPKIKHTKSVGDTKYHFLSWDGQKGGQWLKDDFFDIIDEKGDAVTMTKDETCNTRKSRDKRSRAHTVGLFVAVKPCGTVVLFDELYGSESISQVYGIMIEWLGNLSDMKNIEIVLYDDNCHLGGYSENEKRAAKNDVTKHFASLGKYIDKFHFANHVGKTCVEKRDPYKVKALDNVNTQAAEQLFRDVNKHSNCQAMSESHFYLFWLYIMDLHNLSLTGMDRVEPDPREDYRDSIIRENNINFASLKKTISKTVEVHESSVSIEVSLYSCKICGNSFRKEGNLKNHIETKHTDNIKKKDEKSVCELCSNPFANKLTLENHIKKKHLTCSICKHIFGSPAEMEFCRAKHTTCNICNFNAKFPAKLKRHMESHK